METGGLQCGFILDPMVLWVSDSTMSLPSTVPEGQKEPSHPLPQLLPSPKVGCAQGTKMALILPQGSELEASQAVGMGYSYIHLAFCSLFPMSGDSGANHEEEAAERVGGPEVSLKLSSSLCQKPILPRLRGTNDTFCVS
jgi:hypothetical protein